MWIKSDNTFYNLNTASRIIEHQDALYIYFPVSKFLALDFDDKDLKERIRAGKNSFELTSQPVVLKVSGKTKKEIEKYIATEGIQKFSSEEIELSMPLFENKI